MKPFVLLDVDTMELVFVIKNIVKRFKISNLDNAEDFIDEFYRRFKEINFVPKYNVINRKEFMDMVTGLQNTQVASVGNAEQQNVSVNRPAPVSSGVVVEEVADEDLEKSTLIRANTERKIAIEDLNMRFDEPYDYFDLSLYDQEKIKKSTHLNHFLTKGILVKTTMDEIAKIRSVTIAQKEKEKRDRQEALIVERDKSKDENLISSEDYRNAESNENIDVEGAMRINTGKPVDIGSSEGASAVFEMFSKSDAALGADSARSMDDLLRKA